MTMSKAAKAAADAYHRKYGEQDQAWANNIFKECLANKAKTEKLTKSEKKWLATH
jgi:hypothetical protein